MWREAAEVELPSRSAALAKLPDSTTWADAWMAARRSIDPYYPAWWNNLLFFGIFIPPFDPSKLPRTQLAAGKPIHEKATRYCGGAPCARRHRGRRGAGDHYRFARGLPPARSDPRFVL